MVGAGREKCLIEVDGESESIEETSYTGEDKRTELEDRVHVPDTGLTDTVGPL